MNTRYNAGHCLNDPDIFPAFDVDVSIGITDDVEFHARGCGDVVRV